MSLRLFKLMTGAIFGFLVGCAAAPQVEIAAFDKSATVEASFDAVWSDLIRFLSTNDVSIATIEKESGLIALRGEGLSASLITSYCDAQPTFLTLISSGIVSGSITVIEDSGFVTVNANMRYRATLVNNFSTPPTYFTSDCNSKGVFETALLSSFQ